MVSFSRLFWSSVAITLCISGAGGRAVSQQRPELSGLSDAELSEMAARVAAESARRELAGACATLQRLGVASRPAECAGAALADGGSAQPASPESQPRTQLASADQPTAIQQPQNRNAPLNQAPATQPPQNQDPPPDQQPPVQQPQNDDPPPDPQRNMADDDDNKQRFGGIEFGIGMAFTSDLGDHARVREAQLVNGTVRITRGDDTRARLVLESHYFFTPPGGLPILGLVNPTRAEREKGRQPMWGFGPFVAIQPGTDNVIDAIGGGIMLGLRRGTDGTDSFNIGAGVLFDLDVQTLGDGLVENQPLPAGETEIRFRRRAQSGFMIMSSFSF